MVGRSKSKTKMEDVTAKEAEKVAMSVLTRMHRNARVTDKQLYGMDTKKDEIASPTFVSVITDSELRKRWIRQSLVGMGYKGKKLEYLLEVVDNVAEEVNKDIQRYRHLKTGKGGLINAAYYLARYEKEGRDPIAMYLAGETINAKRYGRHLRPSEKEKAKKVIQDTKEAMERFLTAKKSEEKMKAFKQLKKLMGLDKTFSKLSAFEILARETFMKEYAKRIGVKVKIKVDGVYDASDRHAAYMLQSATKRGKGNILKKRFYSLEKDGMFGPQSVYTALINMDLMLTATYDNRIWKPKDLEKYIVNNIRNPITEAPEVDIKEIEKHLERGNILKSKPRKK